MEQLLERDDELDRLRALLVVVDDAHWADASSLRFLAFLRSRVAELPIAMVLALRPAETGPAGELLAARTIEGPPHAGLRHARVALPRRGGHRARGPRGLSRAE